MNWKWKLAQAAEIRWWKHYLRKQSPEVYLREKRAYWRRVIQQAGIRIQPQWRILDMGCGPAGIFTVLTEMPVDAVDPLLSRYAAELPHFDPRDYPRVRFITGTLEDFRPEQGYELIFCLNAINHVADIEAAMDRLVACLHPGGTLWLSVDAHRYRAVRWIFWRIPGDVLHPHQYGLEEYRQMLTSRGLEVRKSVRLKPGRIFDYYLMEARAPVGSP